FSSAVPLPFVRTVLAADGFSDRDLAIVSSWGRTGRDSAAASPLAANARPRFPTPRQISRDGLRCPRSDPKCELDTEVEPDIAVNPTRPGNVVGVFQMGRYANGGAVDTGWATSFDGGRTWRHRGPA